MVFYAQKVESESCILIGRGFEMEKNESFYQVSWKMEESEWSFSIFGGQKEVKGRGLDSNAMNWVIGRVEKKT